MLLTSKACVWVLAWWHPPLIPTLRKQKQVDLWFGGQPGLHSWFTGWPGLNGKVLCKGKGFCGIGKIAQSVYYLLSKHEDPSSTPRTHIKKLRMVVHTCGSSAREVETSTRILWHACTLTPQINTHTYTHAKFKKIKLMWHQAQRYTPVVPNSQKTRI